MLPLGPVRETFGTRVAPGPGRQAPRGRETVRARFNCGLANRVDVEPRFLLEGPRWLDKELSVFAERADYEPDPPALHQDRHRTPAVPVSGRRRWRSESRS